LIEAKLVFAGIEIDFLDSINDWGLDQIVAMLCNLQSSIDLQEKLEEIPLFIQLSF
jgi:hypothetical protein